MNQGRVIDGLPTGALIPLVVNWARRLQSVFTSAAQVNPPLLSPFVVPSMFPRSVVSGYIHQAYIGCAIVPSSKTESFMRAQPVSSFESEPCESIDVFFVEIGR